MRKYKVEFFRKFQGRGLKIGRVNSIRVAIRMFFFNILHAISPQMTSSRAIVFFEQAVHIHYFLSYTLGSNITSVSSFTTKMCLMFSAQNGGCERDVIHRMNEEYTLYSLGSDEKCAEQ